MYESYGQIYIHIFLFCGRQSRYAREVRLSRYVHILINYLSLLQHTPYGHGCIYIYIYIYPDHTHSFKMTNDH